MTVSSSNGALGPVLDHDWTTPTFRDPTRDDVLREQGFVSFPMLDGDEVTAIRDAHHRLVGADGSGMAVDYMREDRSVITAVNELLDEVWKRHFGEIFVDHRPVFSTCVVKHPGPDSAMFLHDDRSFVDERELRSGTMWIPLVDTGPGIDNGGLQVVPGSHRLAVTFAGSNTPDLMRPYASALEAALVAPPVPAGTALFYDSRMLHASPPNRTDEPRPALACSVVPRQAPLIHVVGVDATRRRIHSIDDDFFLDHRPEELERAMPSCYPVIDEYEDRIDCLDADYVRDTCDLMEKPTAESLIPEDLWGDFDGTRSDPPTEVPRRTGALLATGQPVRSESTDSWVAGVVDAACTGEWLPASLWPGDQLSWWVGDPLARPGNRRPGVMGLRLAPRERLCLRLDAAGTTLVHTVEGPVLGAGIVSVGQADQCEPGAIVSVERVDHCVIWNHGPGDLEVVVESNTGERRWTSSLSSRLERRRAHRLGCEVAAAVRP